MSKSSTKSIDWTLIPIDKITGKKSRYKNINFNERIHEDYDFQYKEDHTVEVVKVGETDLIKEVNSHKDEVGLINVMKLAIAHGEDPYSKFMKTEPGLQASIDMNATLDDAQQLLDQLAGKKAELAKTLGCSIQELELALKNGTVADLVKTVTETSVEESVKDGE